MTTITPHDIERIDIPAEVVEHCKANPLPNCRLPITGQLRAIGDKVLQKVIGFDDDAFNMQLEGARDMGVSCVCEDATRKQIGVSTTVSLVRDHDIMDKKIIVPAGQIRKHAYLDAHHVVAIYVVGTKSADNKLADVQGVYVAGWMPIHKLRRWIQKGGTAPFQVNNMSLAVAPANILQPMRGLLDLVRWHHICV